ncbi:tyrosine-type recombinase/integrase [Lysobacter sp. 2RAF19]
MTRLTNRLTDRALRTLTRPGRFNDGGGLYAFVSDSGARSWVFRYRSRTSGKHRDKGLGALSVVSLAEARRKAEACRKLLSRGIDPIDREQRARARAAEAAAQRRTFGWCLEQYIASRADAWKNEKHKAQWLNSVTTHASRLIGMDVAAITTDDVLAALEAIWTTKTETASRVRQRIEAVIDWATAKKYRYGDNPARWRGHLQNLLAKPGAIKQVEHREALPYADMPECMSKIIAKDSQAARALRMTILTALRAGEVVGARWDEFDFKAGVWTIPAHRMKGPKSQRRDHEVPLFPALMELIESLPKLSDVYVFPGGGRKNPTMSTDAVLNCLQDLDPAYADLTVHGYRSTFRDWVGDCTDFDENLAELALAHKLKDKVAAAYRRKTALDKRRQLMTAWSTFVDTPTKARARD